MKTPYETKEIIKAIIFRFDVVGISKNYIECADHKLLNALRLLVNSGEGTRDISILTKASTMCRGIAYEVIEAYAQKDFDVFLEDQIDNALANLKELLLYQIRPLVDEEDKTEYDVDEETIKMAVDDLISLAEDSTLMAWAQVFGHSHSLCLDGRIDLETKLKKSLKEMWLTHQAEMRDA